MLHQFDLSFWRVCFFNATVGNCFREFSIGCRSQENEPRADSTHTSVTDGNARTVRKLITEDLHITYR